MRVFRSPLCLALLLTALTACQKPAIHLHVPAGFTGRIIVDCNSNSGTTAPTVEIDTQGHGRAATCPAGGAQVLLDGNGQSTTVQSVEWLKTGDGFTTQFRFDLR